MLLKRRLSLLLLAAALTGCGTLAPQSPLPSGARSYHDNIQIAGRLSVRYLQDGKPQSVQGKFLWVQAGPRIDIRLASPLGQTLARIDIAPGIARLEQAARPPAEAANGSALPEAVLGWPLPVEGLRHWLQGYVRDAQGALRPVPVGDDDERQGDGWRVRYVSWQDMDGRACPKRIDFARADAGKGEIALRLVIDECRPEQV